MTSQLVFYSELTDNKELRVFGTTETPYFVAKDIAEFLGYKDTKKAIKDNIYDEDKIMFEMFNKNENVSNILSKTDEIGNDKIFTEENVIKVGGPPAPPDFNRGNNNIIYGISYDKSSQNIIH